MSSPPASARRLVRFGVFELDAHSGELRKSGVRLSVQDQPLQVLKLLLDRPGELVTREELRQQLWPSDTFVGFEHGLNAAVGRLRETLGDSAETPRFIETLPRRGYRFVGTVVDDGAGVAQGDQPTAAELLAPARQEPRPPPARTTYVVAMSAATLALLSLLSWGAFSLGKRAGERPHPTLHQLTFRRGGVVSARFTPDGKTVVYGAAWDGEPVRLFSTRIEGPESSPLPLPDADVADVSSAAELLIVVNRPYLYGLHPGTLARVPLAGGTPRPLAEQVTGADWSSDHQSFAVSREVEDGTRSRVEFPLGTLIHETYGAYAPKLSRDGSEIAFYAMETQTSAKTVTIADLSGRTTILSGGWLWTGRYVAWSPRGDEVWFSATKGGRVSPLRAVSRSGQERIVLNLPGYIHLQEVLPDGRVLLAYGTARREVRCRIAGEPNERNLTWFGWSGAEWLSADGKTLLFHEWDGTPNNVPRAYLRGTDGSPAVRLGECVPINLSPDGTWAVCHDQEADQVLLIPTGAGQPRRMARHGVEKRDFGYGWLPDSKHRLAAWQEKGRPFRTYLVDIDGGKPQPVTPEGMVCTWASPDGKSALCEPGTDGISLIYSLDDKQARPARGLSVKDKVISWSADGTALFIRARQEFPPRIYRLDLASGKRELWREIGPPDRAGLFYDWMSVVMTPDGASYCYTTQNALNDLYLVEGLR